MGVFNLVIGQSAVVTAVRISGAAGERLHSLGIVAGARVTCLAFSLLKGSILLLCGYNRVALRRRIADNIEVSPC